MRVKRLVIGIGVVVLLLFAGSLVAEYYAEKKYSGKLLPVTDGLGIVIGEVNVQLWRGRVRLTEISIPDSLLAGEVAQVGSIDVSGVHWLKLIRDRKVSIKGVSVYDLSASGALSRFTGDSIASPQNISATLERLDLQFDEDMLPRVTGINASNIHYSTGGNYDFEVRRVHTSNHANIIMLDSVIMKPNYSKEEFAVRNGRRVGRVEMVIPEVHIHALDQKNLIGDSIIRIRSIDMIAGDVRLFTDKKVPVDPDRYVPMPHEALLNSKHKVMIDSVNVLDLHLRFESNNASSLKEGSLDFDHSYLTLTNVTNIEEKIKEDHVMHLDLYSKFMGVADLNAHFSFLMDRDDYRFVWNGSLTRMKIKEIDKFTVPVANMNIVQGDCRSVKFEVTSDIDKAVGTIDFSYENLKVMAVDPETHRNRKLFSGVANLFFVNQDNLEGTDGYKTGQIDYLHETNRGLPHYVWTSLERGLMYTILPDGIARRMEQNDGQGQSGGNGNNSQKKKKKK